MDALQTSNRNGFSDHESGHFDDAAVQPENSYYEPVPKNINECS